MTVPSFPHDIESQVFDVIVIGAGINGAGIARDAAMRGLNVLLLDQHDIGSGTTPWSTRLIHGGLRYLEHGEIGLVRESLRERETLLRIAPHLVRPLPFLLPVYDWQRRNLATIRAGLLAYDILSFGKELPAHHMLSGNATRSLVAGIENAGLRGAALYYDCQVAFPERLAVENATAAAEHGATILTHAKVERIVVVDGVARGVDIRPRHADATVRVAGSTIVNVAGPWVDHLLTDIEKQPLIGGTKGSHIVVDPFPGAPCCAVYTEAPSDGRPFFVIPWQGRLLIGTTDAPFEGDPSDARPTAAEIDYLIRQTLAIFPESSLTPASVLITYAGVRPLPPSADRKNGHVTRRHVVR
ncbi:MAG: glycerol-3-phosphate dehydrogenase/oxidase, partial [Vicinamibacterales bacterium]